LASVPNWGSVEGSGGGNELLPLAETERRAILAALRNTGGDRLAAEHVLGMGKTTLYRRLKEYAALLKPST
jgi:DNA-binding NtrC family response regulator